METAKGETAQDRHRAARPRFRARGVDARLLDRLRGHCSLAITLGALILWALALATVAWTRYGGDIRAFICIGTDPYHPAAMSGAPDGGPAGYDGQFYAALATDPFLRRADTPRALDAPTYRATRIGVPLLAWTLALGQPRVAVVAYVIVIWALGLAAVYLAARWLRDDAGGYWWAALLPLAGGLVASVLRATPDAAAVGLILAALLLHREHRTVAAGLALVLACLTRETSILAAGAIGVIELRDRRHARAALFVGLPVLVLVGWQLYLRSRGLPWHDAGAGNFSLPFTALLDRAAGLLQQPPRAVWPELVGVCATVLAVAAITALPWRPASWSPLEPAFVAFAVLGAMLSRDVYVESWAYARVLAVVPFLAVLLAPRQRAGWRRVLLRAVAVLAAVLGLWMVRVEWKTALAGRSWAAAIREGTPGTVAASTEARRPEPATPNLVLVPIAGGRGGDGGRWRTAIEIANRTPVVNQVRVEWRPVRAGTDRPDWRVINLDPRGKASFADVLPEVFGGSGIGALVLIPSAGPITVASRTCDPARPAACGPAAAVPRLARGATRDGSARLTGLQRSTAPARTRHTDVGVFNGTELAVAFVVELRDGEGRPAETLRRACGPSESFVLDDVFSAAAGREVTAGAALVSAGAAGATFLAWAAVVDEASGTVRLVWPTPTR